MFSPFSENSYTFHTSFHQRSICYFISLSSKLHYLCNSQHGPTTISKNTAMVQKYRVFPSTLGFFSCAINIPPLNSILRHMSPVYNLTLDLLMIHFNIILYCDRSGSERDEVTGEWRKLHNEELNDLHCSPNIVRVIK